MATGGTPNAHGKHHAHFHGVVLGPLALRQLRRIEVRRKVLVQHLAFTHIDCVGRGASSVKLLLILQVLSCNKADDYAIVSEDLQNTPLNTQIYLGGDRMWYRSISSGHVLAKSGAEEDDQQVKQGMQPGMQPLQ